MSKKILITGANGFGRARLEARLHTQLGGDAKEDL